jgi:hypothetical protein
MIMNRITRMWSTAGVVAMFAAGAAVVASPAHASEADYVFTTSSGGASISNYTGTSLNPTIPSHLDNQPVRTLEGSSFLDKGLKSVVIGENVDEIHNAAFLVNPDLTSVTFTSFSAPTISPAGNEETSSFDSALVTIYYPFGGYGYTTGNFEGYTTVELPPPPYDETEVDISATINAGVRSASLAEVSFEAATVSHNDQDVLKDALLSVDDLSGTAAGWQVTLEASDLTFTAGPDTQHDNASIDASHLFVKGKNFAGAEDTTSSITGVTLASSTLTALDSPYVVLSALDAQGEGAYVANLTFSLNIPANSRNGNYAGTITTTMAVAPVVP